jgi:hypothetical protein
MAGKNGVRSVTGSDAPAANALAEFGKLDVRFVADPTPRS